MHKRQVLKKTVFIFMLTTTQVWPLQERFQDFLSHILWGEEPATVQAPAANQASAVNSVLDGIKNRFETVKADIEKYAQAQKDLGFHILEPEKDKEVVAIMNSLETLMDEVSRHPTSAEAEGLDKTLKSTYEVFTTAVHEQNFDPLSPCKPSEN